MKATQRDEAIEQLRGQLRPGDTLYTVLRGVSKSGMSRTMDVYTIRNNEPWRLTWSVANATGFTYSRKDDALKVSGAGMDMGYHVAYNLSRVLYPDGFGCIGERCPSNDHSNSDRLYTPDSGHGPDDHTPECDAYPCKHWHIDGGYALRHRWI